MGIRLILSLVERVSSMFAEGETIRNIRSACLFEVGNYFHENDNIDKAMTYYDRALSLNSNNYYACVGLAAIFLRKRLFSDALGLLNTAISVKSPEISTNVLLFVTYESLNQDDLKREFLFQIEKYYNGNKSAAYNRIAYAYRRLHMLKEAENYVKKAIEIDPTRARLHFNLANIYYAQNDFKSARDEYRKVIELATDKKDERFRKYATYNLKGIEEKTSR